MTRITRIILRTGQWFRVSDLWSRHTLLAAGVQAWGLCPIAKTLLRYEECNHRLPMPWHLQTLEPRDIKIVLRNPEGKYVAGSAAAWDLVEGRDRAIIFDFFAHQ